MFYKSNIQTRIRRALICCMLQLLFRLLEVKNNKTNKNIVTVRLFEIICLYIYWRQFIDVETYTKWFKVCLTAAFIEYVMV